MNAVLRSGVECAEERGRGVGGEIGMGKYLLTQCLAPTSNSMNY
jgi:hypothetical protein